MPQILIMKTSSVSLQMYIPNTLHNC